MEGTDWNFMEDSPDCPSENSRSKQHASGPSTRPTRRRRVLLRHVHHVPRQFFEPHALRPLRARHLLQRRRGRRGGGGARAAGLVSPARKDSADDELGGVGSVAVDGGGSLTSGGGWDDVAGSKRGASRSCARPARMEAGAVVLTRFPCPWAC